MVVEEINLQREKPPFWNMVVTFQRENAPHFCERRTLLRCQCCFEWDIKPTLYYTKVLEEKRQKSVLILSQGCTTLCQTGKQNPRAHKTRRQMGLDTFCWQICAYFCDVCAVYILCDKALKRALFCHCDNFIL